MTVVVPELFRAPSLLSAVMRRTTFRLKLRLLREPDIAVTDVPRLVAPDAHAAVEPSRAVCVVPCRRRPRSLAPRPALRAVARLPRDEGRLVRVRRRRRRAVEQRLAAFPDGASRSRSSRRPYRDVGGRCSRTYAEITADPDAVAVVVMPELVARGTDRLLHNQRALYLKRLLLFEPRVILTSVPFQLT